jgi:hypothetical protein
MVETSRELAVSISTDCVAASKPVVDFETAAAMATQDVCCSDNGGQMPVKLRVDGVDEQMVL